MKNLQIQINRHSHRPSIYLPNEMEKVAFFHASLPGYIKTPLISLKELAKNLGIHEILVKDESCRLGLKSFKVLGSSWAMHNLSKSTTFATATDGNHGLGVAWMAKQLNKRAVVYLPKGSSSYRLSKIIEMGADAKITDLDYDDTVRLMAKESVEKGWTLVQDTAWKGYEEVPLLIMQGYMTIVHEYLSESNVLPTHVILQAGVGSFAAAIIEAFRQSIDISSIQFIIVEPNSADCIFQSALDGNPAKASGNLSTIMAGLSCGEVNPLAWDIIKGYAQYFVTCPDEVAEQGMRQLHPKIISGESGAVPLGLLIEICKNPKLKDQFKLNSASKVFFISTEGDTDPEYYKKICN